VAVWHQRPGQRRRSPISPWRSAAHLSRTPAESASEKALSIPAGTGLPKKTPVGAVVVPAGRRRALSQAQGRGEKKVRGGGKRLLSGCLCPSRFGPGKSERGWVFLRPAEKRCEFPKVPGPRLFVRHRWARASADEPFGRQTGTLSVMCIRAGSSRTDGKAYVVIGAPNWT
jgi:hypothetical protein